MKLKGGSSIAKGTKKSKKKKSLSASEKGNEKEVAGRNVKEAAVEGVLEGAPVDGRTEAERRFEASLVRKHKKELASGKQTVLNHQERVNKFNEYLGKLPEHNDIPKVNGSW